MNRPTHIEDYLVTLHTGQWFGFRKDYTGSERMTYANVNCT